MYYWEFKDLHCWSWVCSCLVSAGVQTAGKAQLYCAAGWHWSPVAVWPCAPPTPSPRLSREQPYIIFIDFISELFCSTQNNIKVEKQKNSTCCFTAHQWNKSTDLNHYLTEVIRKVYLNFSPIIFWMNRTITFIH